MKELILMKAGEIALKGLNRSTFEDRLMKNVRRRLTGTGEWKLYKAQSTVYIEPLDEDADIDEAYERMKTVFGFSAMSRACIVEKDYEKIQQAAGEYLRPLLERVRTFKVEAKRSDKSFPMNTPEICRELGGYLLSQFHHLKVDVEHPDLMVMVEVRDYAAYIHAAQEEAAGGLPVGTSGAGLLLASGGIDSPVAGYMMAKRGLELQAIHFAAPPYTSDHARQKVVTLCEKLGEYCGRVRLHVVHFTQIQEAIRDRCPEDLFTVIMRRYMMKISDRVARKNGCLALITGESLAQVASQTLPALACTDVATDLPVLRPVIGMDKREIVEIARRIDTFETSILPYEDCCTVFTPKHPRTRPTLEMILRGENALDEEALLAEALGRIETLTVYPRR